MKQVTEWEIVIEKEDKDRVGMMKNGIRRNLGNQ